MNMINVIIVDDEPLALDILETFIQLMPELNLIARCANAFEAKKALEDAVDDFDQSGDSLCKREKH